MNTIFGAKQIIRNRSIAHKSVASKEPRSLNGQMLWKRERNSAKRMTGSRMAVPILDKNSLSGKKDSLNRGLSSIIKSPKLPGKISINPFQLSALTISLVMIGIVLFITVSPVLSLRDPLSDLALPLNPDVESEMLLSFISPELSFENSSLIEVSSIDVPKMPVKLQVTPYTVCKGDNLGAISNRFKISMDSLISLNGIKSASRLAIGTVLKIPNISGVLHTVSRGDSLSSISKRYQAEIVSILDANDLSSEVLIPGSTLYIPGAKLSLTEMKKVLGNLIIWPLRGRLSSYFGYRNDPVSGKKQFHNGIDIVANFGYAVKATMEGKVSDTGYNSVYGNYVILSHPDGYQSLYGHLSKILVKKGTYINQNIEIGKTGNTGISTGTHLHFSLFKNGSAINPLRILDY